MPVSDEPTLWGEVATGVSTADVQVQVDLRRAGRIEGRVVMDEAPSESTVQPWSRASIMAIPADGRSLGPSMAPMGRVEPNGTFRTSGLPPGPYTLVLIEDPTQQSSGLYVQSLKSAGAHLDGSVIELDIADLTDIEIRVSRATAELSGIVRDRQARLTSTATVYLFPRDRRLWADLGPTVQRLRAVQPSGDGSYIMRGVPPGEYFVAALSGGARENWRHVTALEELATTAQTVALSARGRGSVALTLPIGKRPTGPK